MLVGIIFRHRVWIWRQRRIHHGLVGFWLTVAGLALMLDDILDCGAWRRDFRRS